MIGIWHIIDILDNLALIQVILPPKTDAKVLRFLAHITFCCTCTHSYEQHIDICGQFLCTVCRRGGKTYVLTFRGGLRAKCSGMT
jgi:hypothetical protein